MRSLTLAAALLATSPALPADLGSDEISVVYPDDRRQVRLVLVYHNHADKLSGYGWHVIETRYGPITLWIEISGGPETLRVVEWPQDLWPYPPEIVVEDGDEGVIEFIRPMS